jgi:hypothetical protein
MVDLNQFRGFIGAMFPRGTAHGSQLKSVANAALGLLQAGTLGTHAIGQGYAACSGILAKSAIWQICRLLGNPAFDVTPYQRALANFSIQNLTDITLIMDWTEYAGDEHSTLSVCLATDHGRATPLIWRTYRTSCLKGNMRAYEDEMIETLHDWLDPSVRVTLLADRGFASVDSYQFLQTLGWDFVIRFRGDIRTTREDGITLPARDWLPAGEERIMLRRARVTARQVELPAVVVAKEKGMKGTWCLATTRDDLSASENVQLYGHRFAIEETFRDTKDPRFGMGLSATHTKDARRRDRLLLIAAIVQVVLTMMGAASERVGLDKTFKANTSKRRTHSLFRQGQLAFQALPSMPRRRSVPLLAALAAVVTEHLSGCTATGVLCARFLARPTPG